MADKNRNRPGPDPRHDFAPAWRRAPGSDAPPDAPAADTPRPQRPGAGDPCYGCVAWYLYENNEEPLPRDRH